MWLPWRTRPLLALALVHALAFATSCARPSSGAAVSSASATRLAAKTAESPRPPAASLHVGASGDYPPFSRWKEDHAEDFAPALVGAFAAEQKLEVSWTRFRWPDLVADLRAGRFELAADGITVRPERSVAGRFTVPVARGGAVLLLRRPAWAQPAGSVGPSRADALAALRAFDRPELRVAVNRGGHLEHVARSLLQSAQIRAIPDNPAVRTAFARGEVDAALSNTFEAPRWAEGLEGIEAIGPLTRDVVALYVRADQLELAARLDAFLLAEEEKGALGRLRARYLGPLGGGPTALPMEALLSATAERLALMPLVAAAKRRAGRAVEDAAQEARVIEAARAVVVKAAADRGVPPPPNERIDAFFRAQIEAAKVVQGRARSDASGPVFSLEDDLRPAIARITARMAFLLVRIPRGVSQAAVLSRARDELSDSGLEPADMDRLAASLAAFGQ
jgi:cyclohexadienyl dehydratase